MPRKAQWPPPIYPRNGVDRIRIRQDGKPHDITLGPTARPSRKPNMPGSLLR